MSSFKTLAGAVAMVAAAAALSTSATAADLMHAPMMAPPLPPMAEGISGLYLRGDVGVSSYESSKVTSTFANPAIVVPGFMVDKSSFDSVAFAGVGIGYQVNNWLRFDVTGEYRTASKFSAIESFTNNGVAFPLIGGCGARCYDTYSASIQSSVFLANAYVDLGTWRGITPYIGGGVGMASHKVKGLYDLSAQPAGGFGFAPDTSKTGFAWALMAGLGFEVTRNLKMDLGYRYLNMGDVTSGQIACAGVGIVCPLEVQKYALTSHDVKVGFRYLLADDAPPSMPMGGPLVRKY